MTVHPVLYNRKDIPNTDLVTNRAWILCDKILIYESDQEHGSIYNYIVKTNFRINLTNKSSCENGQFDINQVSKGLILEDRIRQ